MNSLKCKKCGWEMNPNSIDGYSLCERCEGETEPLIADSDGGAEVTLDCRVMDDLGKAAQSLFDNRLGWSAKANPFAPREFWADLGAALYGEDDPRVKELR